MDSQRFTISLNAEEWQRLYLAAKKLGQKKDCIVTPSTLAKIAIDEKIRKINKG